MKKKGLIVGIILVLATTLTSCIKVVKIGEEASITGTVVFNAGDNVAEIWDTLAIPNLNQKAIELKDFLTEASGDIKSLDQKYGKYSMGSSGELSFTVKGTAVVEEVNQEKKAGYMIIKLVGYSGNEAIKIQTGTVFKGSAIRDSLDIIKYDDYKNQVEWGAVSQSIHEVVQNKVIDGVDLSNIVGKQIEFVGCFTFGSNDEILITPVEITIE